MLSRASLKTFGENICSTFKVPSYAEVPTFAMEKPLLNGCAIGFQVYFFSRLTVPFVDAPIITGATIADD